jgi:hypothetical protein
MYTIRQITNEGRVVFAKSEKVGRYRPLKQFVLFTIFVVLLGRLMNACLYGSQQGFLRLQNELGARMWKKEARRNERSERHSPPPPPPPQHIAKESSKQRAPCSFLAATITSPRFWGPQNRALSSARLSHRSTGRNFGHLCMIAIAHSPQLSSSLFTALLSRIKDITIRSHDAKERGYIYTHGFYPLAGTRREGWTGKGETVRFLRFDVSK